MATTEIPPPVGTATTDASPPTDPLPHATPTPHTALADGQSFPPAQCHAYGSPSANDSTSDCAGSSSGPSSHDSWAQFKDEYLRLATGSCTRESIGSQFLGYHFRHTPQNDYLIKLQQIVLWNALHRVRQAAHPNLRPCDVTRELVEEFVDGPQPAPGEVPEKYAFTRENFRLMQKEWAKLKCVLKDEHDELFWLFRIRQQQWHLQGRCVILTSTKVNTLASRTVRQTWLPRPGQPAWTRQHRFDRWVELLQANTGPELQAKSMGQYKSNTCGYSRHNPCTTLMAFIAWMYHLCACTCSFVRCRRDEARAPGGC